EQMPAKRLDGGDVPQVEPEDFQAMPPLFKVRFARIARRGIPGEAGRYNQVRARAQQFDAGLITDLHPPAGQQRHASAQVGKFGPLAIIRLRARRTRLVVEMVDLRIVAFADVAILRLGRFAKIGVRYFLRLDGRWWRQVWCGENGFATQRANAGVREHLLGARAFLRLAEALLRL